MLAVGDGAWGDCLLSGLLPDGYWLMIILLCNVLELILGLGIENTDVILGVWRLGVGVEVRPSLDGGHFVLFE